MSVVFSLNMFQPFFAVTPDGNESGFVCGQDHRGACQAGDLRELTVVIGDVAVAQKVEQCAGTVEELAVIHDVINRIDGQVTLGGARQGMICGCEHRYLFLSKLDFFVTITMSFTKYMWAKLNLITKFCVFTLQELTAERAKSAEFKRLLCVLCLSCLHQSRRYRWIYLPGRAPRKKKRSSQN
jgi:hypothetical protein